MRPAGGGDVGKIISPQVMAGVTTVDYSRLMSFKNVLA